MRNRTMLKKYMYACFIIMVIALPLFLASCGGSGGSATWTVLAYMDGDNNLSQAALLDLQEMEMARPSSSVNVVVQIDLNNGVTTQRYVIENGTRTLLSDLGELDMADPRTLTDFLVWAKDAYPADRTVLVLWNHGNGWDQNDGPSQPAPEMRRSILYDDDNGSDFLPNHEVRKAVEAAGVTIDVLGLDASIMGTIEALYEFSSLAPIIISSQEVGESHGWDYTTILSSLADRPGMSCEAFAAAVIDSYRNFFEDLFYPTFPAYEQRHTIAAHRSLQIRQIASQAGILAVDLSAMLADPLTRDETLTLIGNARADAQAIDRYVQPNVYVDLVDLESKLVPLGLGTQISELVSQGTIASYTGSDRPNAHGVSIVFFRLPEALAYNTYDENYSDYDPQTGIGSGGGFINEYTWDEFLATYYTAAGLL